MYEVLVICFCTSCISCVCCFLSGALLALPKLVIHKCQDIKENCKTKTPEKSTCDKQTEPAKEIPSKSKVQNHSKKKKNDCKCEKRETVHTLAAPKEKICGPKKRKCCQCPLKTNLNNYEQSEFLN